MDSLGLTRPHSSTSLVERFPAGRGLWRTRRLLPPKYFNHRGHKESLFYQIWVWTEMSSKCICSGNREKYHKLYLHRWNKDKLQCWWTNHLATPSTITSSFPTNYYKTLRLLDQPIFYKVWNWKALSSSTVSSEKKAEISETVFAKIGTKIKSSVGEQKPLNTLPDFLFANK